MVEFGIKDKIPNLKCRHRFDRWTIRLCC